MNKPKIALFPGSFDPITNGHIDIVLRALPLFDEIHIGVGINSQKKYLFDLEQRLNWIKESFAEYDKVHVNTFKGLTINYAKDISANYMLRGIRSAADFEYEKTIAHLNKAMDDEVETILILSKPELSSVSSTIVREIIMGGGDVHQFIPAKIAADIKES